MFSLHQDERFEQPIMPIEDRLIYRGWVRSAMATRKGMNISGICVVHHKFYAFFIYGLYILNIES